MVVVVVGCVWRVERERHGGGWWWWWCVCVCVCVEGGERERHSGGGVVVVVVVVVVCVRVCGGCRENTRDKTRVSCAYTWVRLKCCVQTLYAIHHVPYRTLPGRRP